MDDDFNSSAALASLFELVRVINQTRADGGNDCQLEPAQSMIRKLTSVLGLTLDNVKGADQDVSGFVDLLIEVRKDLRENKLWAISDKIRNRLAELGIVLEDSKDGTSWHRE